MKVLFTSPPSPTPPRSTGEPKAVLLGERESQALLGARPWRHTPPSVGNGEGCQGRIIRRAPWKPPGAWGEGGVWGDVRGGFMMYVWGAEVAIKAGGGRPQSTLSREMLTSMQLLLLMGWIVTENCVSICILQDGMPPVHSRSHSLPLGSPSNLRGHRSRRLQEPRTTVCLSKATHPGTAVRLGALGCYQSELTGPSPNKEKPWPGLQHRRLVPSRWAASPDIIFSRWQLKLPLGHSSSLHHCQTQIRDLCLGLLFPQRGAADQRTALDPCPPSYELSSDSKPNRGQPQNQSQLQVP